MAGLGALLPIEGEAGTGVALDLGSDMASPLLTTPYATSFKFYDDYNSIVKFLKQKMTDVQQQQHLKKLKAMHREEHNAPVAHL